MDIEEREEVQAKGIRNIFNKITAENSPKSQERDTHTGTRGL
jgi:hypothetical protein